MFHHDKRLLMRGRVPSTATQVLQSWLASKEAADWRASRVSIFGTGMNPPAVYLLAFGPGPWGGAARRGLGDLGLLSQARKASLHARVSSATWAGMLPRSLVFSL